MEILRINNASQINRRFEKLPSFIFNAIELENSDENWALKLNNSIIKFTLLCFDEKDNNVGILSEKFVPNVSPYQILPIIHYNFASIQFKTNLLFIRIEDCAYFKIVIELENHPLTGTESLLINGCFTETTKIRLICSEVLDYWVYITDNNPRTPRDERTITVLPINRETHHLNTRNHVNLLFAKGTSDEEIIASIKLDPRFNCN